MELAPGFLPVEGFSDTLPIQLQSDKATEIRSLLKYLYAPACNAQVPEISVTELDNVLAVARLAHKYEMETWQSWVEKVILHWLTQAYTSFSSVQYCTICELAYVLQDDDLREKTTITHKHHTDGLAPIHIQRLLVGYWSLAESWARFRHGMIPLTCPATCFLEKHTGLCQPLFKSSWERAVAQAEWLPITATVNRIQMLLSTLRSLAPLISKTPGMDVPWDGAPCVYVPSNLPDDPFVRLMAGIPKSLERHFFASDPVLT
ncbi:hypothetical protein B0H14DRAFT_3493769 [Mycena olivaceomarginata]|nr:hypothetical protein B0H14DRAFT_3493769 [Mycena olivaceomarginata]